MLDAALNLLFPPLCRACGSLLSEPRPSLLCLPCRESLQPLREPVCSFCGAPLEEESDRDRGCSRCPRFKAFFERARSAVRYESPYRELIHQFKFHNSFRVRPLLLDTFLKGAETHYRPAEFDGLVPIPLHWWRRFQREFNQAEVLAESLSAKWKLPMLSQAVVRQRHSLPQSRLRGEQRRTNLEGAFRPGKGGVEGLRLLLIDDVMTTGATLSACAEVLSAAGAKSVSALTLARRL